MDRLRQRLDGLAKDVVLLRRTAEGRGDVREVLQSLLGSHLVLIHDAARAVKLQRSQPGVLREHLVERLVVRPCGGLGLGGVYELRAHLSAGGVEENGVSNGGAVLVIDVPYRELGGGLGAGGRPDGYRLNGNDVGIH